MNEITRREAFSAVGAMTAGLTITDALDAAPSPAGASAAGMEVAMRINGKPFRKTLDPRVTLLDFLREHAGLTGTRKGCDHGQCGACTVIANGRRINSCLSLAVTHEGDEIVTIEGIARGGELHPAQAAFIEHDGFQCGYCTPGQICSAVALISELKRGDASALTANLPHPDMSRLSDDDLRERMSGNICRCGAYPGIIAAVRQAAAPVLESRR